LNTPEAKSTPPNEKWNSLVGSIVEFERNPEALSLESLDWTNDSQWSRSAYRMLVGIIRNRTLLLYLSSQFVSKQPKPKLQAFLLLGIYQLLDSRSDKSRLPKIVHHTVELITANCSSREGKFANAVIRKIADSVDTLVKELEKTRDWTTLYSHPQWLIDRWITQIGESETQKLLISNQQIPSLYIHDYGKLLHKSGNETLADDLGLEATKWADFYEISKRGRSAMDPILALPLYIQDPSTSVATALFGDSLTGNILDACAAPGGKTILLHKKLQHPGDMIYAIDRDSTRVGIIKENRDRLNLGQVETLICNWEYTHRPSEMPEYFDGALVDAPCSSIGIIQKHPEIRWRLKSSDFEKLPKQQLSILSAVAHHLKPGAKLVYSTCSIDPAENTEVVQAFLSSEAGSGYKLLQEIRGLPHEHKHDGVGVTLMEKTH
jgi:16S rRNA (cytosine967-C5)-methyltransferase